MLTSPPSPARNDAATPPYVGEAEIAALGLAPGEVREAVRRAYLQLARGEAVLVPKSGLYPSMGGLFHAMPAVIGDLAIMKWVTIGAAPPSDGLRPSIHATMLATDVRSGETIAVVEANVITAVRTAAVSALAVEALSAPDADTLAVIGCGVQGRAHVAALRAVRPIRRVVACSGRRSTAEAFAAEMAGPELAVDVVDDPAAAVAAAPIVLSAVTFRRGRPRFLDLADVRPGALALAVDLGLSWREDALAGFDRVVTDDAAHLAGAHEDGIVPVALKPDAELASLLAGTAAGRKAADERVLVLAPGTALGDAAVARLVLARLGLVAATP